MTVPVLITNPEISLYYTNEEQRRLAEGIAAIAAGVVATLLAARALNIGTDAIDKEYEIRDRIHELQNKYIQHWQNVDYPQQDSVSSTIYGLSADSADYSGVLSDVSGQGYDTGYGANLGIDALNSKNRVDCDQRGCRTGVDMMIPIAVVQSSHYLYRHQERTRYDMDDQFRKFAALAHRGIEMKPDQAFALLGNATSLYSAIGGAAMQSASNSASVAGNFFGIAGGSL